MKHKNVSFRLQRQETTFSSMPTQNKLERLCLTSVSKPGANSTNYKTSLNLPWSKFTHILVILTISRDWENSWQK
jgi:hypothetical protein